MHWLLIMGLNLAHNNKRINFILSLAYHYSTTMIRRVDNSDVQKHGKWRFTGMILLLKAVLNSSDPGQYIKVPG